MQETKKKLNKKGISGVDIAVAIVVISIGLSIIVSLFIVINNTNNKMNREIEATQLAKSVLEKIKIMPYADFLNMILETSNENYSMSLGIEIPEAYTVNIDVERRTPSNIQEAILFNIRKEGNVEIQYMLSNQMTELKLPYVKYFDRAKPMNKPNLASLIIESPNTYDSTEVFEPLDDITLKPIASDELDNWYNYGLKNASLNKKHARRKNINGGYDLFYWEPRHIEVGDEKIYLLGKTMYATESYVKEVEFPLGVFSNVVITSIEEKIGLPSSETEDGKWIYMD